MLCGLLTGLTIRYLPGNGGHSPAFGFKTGGPLPADRELPAIVLASLATLSLGAVLGPEAPLIAIGGGLAALTIHLVKKDAPPMAVTILASAGSFAAISTLLGSPVLGAFLIMEAAGVAGATLSLVALPGLLASGIGAMVFVGLDAWTGLGTFSLSLTTVPPESTPTVMTLVWAGAMGVGGALLGWCIRWIGLSLRPVVHRNRVLVTGGLGLLVGLIAMTFQLLTDHPFTMVLFSGQDDMPDLVDHAADYSIGFLLLLALSKSLAYGVSLSAFRGGPVFPAMFVGATLGIAASHLPGMDLAPAIGGRHRRDVRGDAPAAAHLDPAGDPAPGRRRALGHPPGRRRRGRRLRRDAVAARPRPGGGSRARASVSASAGLTLRDFPQIAASPTDGQPGWETVSRKVATSPWQSRSRSRILGRRRRTRRGRSPATPASSPPWPSAGRCRTSTRSSRSRARPELAR